MTSLKFQASSSEGLQAVIDVAQACIVGCEATRYVVRSMHLSTSLSDESKLQEELALSCCNSCTLCTVTCCAMSVCKPEAAIIGAGCSVIGCCIDTVAYHRLLDHQFKTGYSKLN